MREVTGAVRVAEPLSDFDIDQARDIIVVHDRTTETISLVDERTHLVVNTATVPSDVCHSGDSPA